MSLATRRRSCGSSQALAVPAPLARNGPPPPPRLDELARALGVATSRRGVVGGLLAALLAPRRPAAGAKVGRRNTCPCPDPPCPLGVWGTDPGAPGQLDRPVGVAVAPDGAVYVADMDNHRIQHFNADGTFLGTWGGEGTGAGQFDAPTGVAVAPDGTVYVADAGNHRVQAFGAAGAFLRAWGRKGSGGGQFDGPAGVAVSPDGTVYVTETGNRRVQAFCVTP